MPLTGDYLPSASARAAKQVQAYESSGGTTGNTIMGLPVVILTMRGARSGQVRKTPLMRVEHDGSYAAVASQGGAPRHPQWFHNLVAHPDVELQDGPAPAPYRARLVSGDERALWWERAVAAFPHYASYEKKTDREIPVFVLDPR